MEQERRGGEEGEEGQERRGRGRRGEEGRGGERRGGEGRGGERRGRRGEEGEEGDRLSYASYVLETTPFRGVDFPPHEARGYTPKSRML